MHKRVVLVVVNMSSLSSFFLGHGDELSAGKLTLLVGCLTASAEQSVRQYKGLSQEFRYSYDSTSCQLKLAATAHPRQLLFLFRGVEVNNQGAQVTKAILSEEGREHSSVPLVQVEHAALMHAAKYDEVGSWFYDVQKKEMWLRPGVTASSLGLMLQVSGIKNAAICETFRGSH